MPRALVSVLLRTPAYRHSPKERAIVLLLKGLIDDALNEITYEAGLAGLGASFGVHVEGILLQLEGYHECLASLLETVIEQAIKVTFDEQTFERIKDSVRPVHLEIQYIAGYKAFRHQRARELANMANKGSPIGHAHALIR